MTPYAALEAALESLHKARVKLDDALYIAQCNDRKVTVTDIRTMWTHCDALKQAEKDLEPMLPRLRRLS